MIGWSFRGDSFDHRDILGLKADVIALQMLPPSALVVQLRAVICPRK
jgi:hypothetical protein